MQGTLLKGTMAELDLIERHLLMLRAAKENQPVGIIRLSEITGIPRHKVRYSLRLLEKDGLIIATPEGATVSNRYYEFIGEVEASLAAVTDRAAAISKTLDGDRENSARTGFR